MRFQCLEPSIHKNYTYCLSDCGLAEEIKEVVQELPFHNAAFAGVSGENPGRRCPLHHGSGTAMKTAPTANLTTCTAMAAGTMERDQHGCEFGDNKGDGSL